MKVNGNDARKYGAKQITVEIQPPDVSVSYEWIPGALRPAEFATDVTMGHLKLCVYFRGKDRGSVLRAMSEFMSNFMASCELELDGYRGKYKGFLTASDYEKTVTEKRNKVNLELDGYFFDEEAAVTFDGVTAGEFYVGGSRETPCIVEVYAKSALEAYTVAGLGSSSIAVRNLAAGQTAIIDGTRGTVTISGSNAFDKVDLWEFPYLKAGISELAFSDDRARVTVRYHPTWI